jgi:hypothetical protein
VSWERPHWELALVLEHLSGYVVTRRVDSKGQVSVSNRNHHVACRLTRLAATASCAWREPIDVDPGRGAAKLGLA